ncbi:MAG: CRISPR-associated protein Cas4, partial [Acidimicrobiales bacterium]
NRTVEVISEVRAWLAADRLPPAVDDERCTKCQLVDLCLPGACAHPRQVTGHLERRVYSCES